MKKLAIFASGSGTNAQNIIEYFLNSKKINISLVLSNNKEAYVLERAKKFNITTLTFTANELKNTDVVLNKLKEFQIDFIVLAGFMLMIPENILIKYYNKIINIHPALLPKFGGKGMFGIRVHKAVINAGEKESGITIHYVNKNYDEGEIIFQAKCIVENNDTPEYLAEKIHLLEYEHYPKEIEKIVSR
jgi:phosphoribosylglycinamide formyltransferase-1